MPSRLGVNKKSIAFCGVSSVIGILLMQLYVRRLEREISGGPSIPVVVAARDILPGIAIDRTMLAVRGIPQAYVQQRHVRASDVEMVLGANAGIEVKANESLLWTDLSTTQHGRRSLSALVQEGMRAISVKAQVSAFAGLVRPGDRVDLLFTTRSNFENTKAQSTSTLLQNLLVLAIGNDIGGSDDPSQTNSGQVTLSVTVEQGQLLTQAEHQGTLKLVLRNPNDIVLLQNLPQTASTEVMQMKRSALWSRVNTANGPNKELDHVR
jgi:pilus assembly protein CpaB